MRFHIGTEYRLYLPLIAFPVLFEPVQYIGIDSDANLLFAFGQNEARFCPIRVRFSFIRVFTNKWKDSLLQGSFQSAGKTHPVRTVCSVQEIAAHTVTVSSRSSASVLSKRLIP